MAWYIFCMCLYSPSKHQICYWTFLFCWKKNQMKRKAEESEDKNVEVPKFDTTYKDLMAMVVCATQPISNAWSIVVRTWVPWFGEIDQEQIYIIRDRWRDVTQPVGKRRQINTTDILSWCGQLRRVAGVQFWQPYNTLLHSKEPSSASQTD